MENRFLLCRFGRKRAVRELVWLLLAALCLIIPSSEKSAAQTLNSGQSLLPDQQLQQLQQLGQQRSGTTQSSVTPQEVILEPAGRPNARLPQSRLETILSTRAGAALNQFGYDQFGMARPVSLPQVGAIQDDYVLGSGDEVVITLRGQENAEYRTTVDRDGNIMLPRLPPISAGGRTLGEYRRDLINAVHRAYVGTEAYVTVGRLRQVTVQVSGEVNNPGVRILTGLSSPIDAILISGGIKKTGSLRHVVIQRGGKTITVDLYGVLTGQATANKVVLTDGDRIVVPSLGPTVAVVGWVRRPGIYEMAPGRTSMSTHELLSLGGGLEVRGKYRLSVLRVASDGRNEMVPLDQASGTVGDSDILFVQPAASETTSMATLSGGTPLAGQYPAGTRLSELLKSPGLLGQDPYTLFGIISRRDPVTLMRRLIPFTPVAVLKGSEDMVIQTGDIVRVIQTKEAQFLFTAVQQYNAKREQTEEALRNPLSGTPVNASRQQYGTGGAMQSAAQDNFSNGLAARQAMAVANNQALQPPNTGYVPGLQGSAGPDQQQNQYQPQYDNGTNQYGQGGSSASPDGSQGAYPYGSYGSQRGQGRYGQPYDQPQMPYTQNLQAPLTAPDQVSTNLDVRRIADLASQLRVDPLVLINFLSDRSVNIDGAILGPGLYLVGPDADVSSLIAASGGLARWADKSSVEVISTSVDADLGKSETARRTLSLANGADAEYIVSPHDEVRIKEVFTDVKVGSITVQGQVRHVGTYQIVRGEHLSDVLMRAGGLTDTAYPYGTVFLRRSASERERDAFRREATEIEDQLLLAMSRRDPNAKLSPDAFTALQSYVNQLKNQKPLGRVSIVADPAVLAANPAEDPLVEPGDVVYVPQRPYSVAVLGEVLQPGSVPFRPNLSVTDYIDHAGGYSQAADQSQTILVLPDGSARRLESSWFSFGGDDIPPGSTIYVARDISGLDLHQIIVDTTAIMSQLATSAAALAVLSTQVK
jgi:polysaccharide biosynthesis/export protein